MTTCEGRQISGLWESPVTAEKTIVDLMDR